MKKNRFSEVGFRGDRGPLSHAMAVGDRRFARVPTDYFARYTCDRGISVFKVLFPIFAKRRRQFVTDQ